MNAQEEVSEIHDIALEVVVRGILPSDKDGIEKLAKDANENPASVKLYAQRLVSIVSYVIEERNSKNNKKAQIGYLRRMLIDRSEMVDGLQRELEEYLPLPEQWQIADLRSIAAMKSQFIHDELVSRNHRNPEQSGMSLDEVLSKVPPLTESEQERIFEVCKSK